MKLVKAMMLCGFLSLAMGCAHAHRPAHTHTPVVPDAVKARCALTADHPRTCVNRWKDNHSYTHRHGRGHHHRHGHKHAHHTHDDVKAKVQVGVVVPLS